MSAIITLLLVLFVAGFLLFILERFIPIDENIKQLIKYIVIFLIVMAVILFLLDLFGIYPNPIKF